LAFKAWSAVWSLVLAMTCLSFGRSSTHQRLRVGEAFWLCAT